MSKRLLNCFTSDFRKMSGQDLKNAIKASEGRTVLSENVVNLQTVSWQEPLEHTLYYSMDWMYTILI